MGLASVVILCYAITIYSIARRKKSFMSRCYWCGKKVNDEDAKMLNVILGVGKGYSRQGRRLFHQHCAANAKAKCRRQGVVIFLVAIMLGLGIYIGVRDSAVIAGLVVFIGSIISLAEFFSYS